MRAHRSGEEFFSVSQHALLRLKLNVFVLRRESCLIDLLALKPPEIGHTQPILFGRLQLVQLVRRRSPLGKRLANRIGVQAAEAIQQTALLRLIKGSERLSLRVHQRKFRRELP